MKTLFARCDSKSLLRAALTTGVLGLPFAACEPAAQAPSAAEVPNTPSASALATTDAEAAYQAWRSALVPNDLGIIYVDGDLPLLGEPEIRRYYDDHIGNPQALTAYKLDDGSLSTWPLETRRDLTYCLDYTLDWPHPEYRQIAEETMAEAAAAWEAVTDVKFRHKAEDDGWGCDHINSDAVFRVRFGTVNGGRANAFRPHYSAEARVITISETGFENDIQFNDPDDGIKGRSLAALLKHELGHVLGFDHEMVWSWDQDCSDLDWSGRQQLTPVDTASVMWYPGSCESSHTGDYEITDYDRLGAMCHYTRGISPATCSVFRNGADYLWWNDGAAHSTQSLSIGGLSIPLTGDFDGDGFDDIFWYGRGTSSDGLWWGGPSFGLGSATINGKYDPFVGDFNGDGRSDIFWYASGSAQDSLWFGRADRGFDKTFQSVVGAYEPIVGDFDGNGCSDIFWYAPGSGDDSIWYYAPDKSWGITPITVNGTYRVTSGDFDGDGRSDIVFHQAGDAGDAVWFGNTTKGSFSKHSKTVNGDYHPFALDLDGDGRDEIFWYGAGSKADVVWDVSAQRSVFSRSETVNGYYSPVAGDFDGDGDDDILWYAPL